MRMTWTRLAQTADEGANSIELEFGQADWPIGGSVAIATTGNKQSQTETEVRVISSMSADGKTIILNAPLK